MRVISLTIGLILWAVTAPAFTLEESRQYDVAAPSVTLKILSTADVEVFEPIILAFQADNPDVAIQYDVASSAEVMRALYDEGAAYDLALSSAMDLQTKLANDGYAQSYRTCARPARVICSPRKIPVIPKVSGS